MSIVQSVIFNRDSWTIREAKKWLKENGFVYPKVDTKIHYYRFRQINPDDLADDGYTKYRIKDIGHGIMLVLAFDK